MANGGDPLAAQKLPETPASLADLRQEILRLQARQNELEAENQTLRQTLASAPRSLAPAHPDQPDMASSHEVQKWRDTLAERVKELHCLYDIRALLSRADLTQGALAQAIVDRLPAAYQYPEVTCASLTIGDRRYVTHIDAATSWQQSGVVPGTEGPIGTLTVWYLEKRPVADEGPFLKEERALIDEICAQLGQALEHRRLHATLSASERRFRALIENSGDGILLVGSDRQLRYASPSAARILGYAVEELMQPNTLAIHPDDLEKIESGWRQTYTMPEQAIIQVYRARHFDGSWRWLEATITNLLADPAVEAVVVNFRDITERKQAELTIVENERLYRTAILGAGAVPYHYDYATQTYTFMPPESEALTGYSVEEMTPRLYRSLILDAIPRGDATAVSLDEAIERSRSGTSERLWQWDFLIRTKAGAERWIADAAVQLLDDQGKPVGSIGILQDVTERMQTEAALRASEERYRRLVEQLEERVEERTAEVRDLYETAPCGYGTIDATGTITMVNQTELDWLGFARDEVIGRPVHEFLTPESVQIFADHFPRLIADGAIADLEFEFQRKDGSALPVTLSATALYDADGRFVECRSSFFDITQRRKAQRALLASEARLNHLLAHTPAIIYTAAITAHGVRTTFLSESTYRLLGYTAEGNRGNPGFWNSLIHPDDTPTGKEWIQELLATGSAIWEHRVRHANGDYRWHTTGMSRLEEADTQSQFVGYSVDIHERKLARDALRVSEARYRSVLQNVPVNIAEVDRRGAILSQNRTLLGAPVETIVGQTLLDVAPPDAAPAIRHALDAVFNRGESVQYESSLEVAPGDVRHFVSYAGPVGANRIESAVVVTMDVSELKQAQAALQQQRDFAQQVMDALGEGLVVGDRAQRAAYVNPFMAHLLESTPSELLGGVLADYALAEDIPRVTKMLAEHGHEATHRYELRIVTTSGRVVPTLVSTTPRWVNGELAGRIAVFTDLTRIKQIEADLRQSGEELRAANAALEKAMQLKDEFLASMSHELRTPLTGILGLSESLQLQTAGKLNERQQRAVRHIWESGQHLLDLINDILDLSKLAANQLELEKAQCPIVHLCQASLTLVRGMASQKKQSIAFEIQPDEIVLFADARRLKQVLVNLLSNAIKFTPNGGELGLRVRGDSDRQVVEFRVWDKGIGIAAQDLSHIFDPFTQVDSSLTRQHSGSGLGLALVKRMVHLHGGTIEVASEPGLGSTFILTLPWPSIGESQTTPDTAPAMAHDDFAAEPDPTVANQASRRVLIADDDPLNAEILYELLTSSGYSVAVAANGMEVLHMAASFAPELILMDIRMPQMDGLEAMRRLRALPDPTVAATPIIMLTAQAMEGDAERCLAAGASAYIAKPYSIHTVLAEIEEMLAPKDLPK